VQHALLALRVQVHYRRTHAERNLVPVSTNSR
jgi:hypothetical protein